MTNPQVAATSPRSRTDQATPGKPYRLIAVFTPLKSDMRARQDSGGATLKSWGDSKVDAPDTGLVEAELKGLALQSVRKRATEPVAKSAIDARNTPHSGYTVFLDETASTTGERHPLGWAKADPEKTGVVQTLDRPLPGAGLLPSPKKFTSGHTALEYPNDAVLRIEAARQYPLYGDGSDPWRSWSAEPYR
jgi:hypothetical protein